jgi:isocitrate lyase
MPTYPITALSPNSLSNGYFGKEGMLACVVANGSKASPPSSTRTLANSNITGDHKKKIAGEVTLAAGGKDAR